MKSIYKLIKKLLRNGVIGIIIAATTLICTILFGYSQYAKSKGQKISPVVMENIDASNEHRWLIVRTNDTIKLDNPPICQTFRNTSKYTINNLFIETTVISPNYQGIYIFYQPSEEHKFYNQRVIGDKVYSTYTYKAESLFPNETTVPFVKEITMMPQEKNDSGFYHFYIESKVRWDGQPPIEYFSFINYKCIEDDNNVDHLIKAANSQDLLKYKSWLNKVVNGIKDRVSEQHDFDFLLAYHSYFHMDSLQENNIARGAVQCFHNMNNYNVDSIVNPSSSFIRRHDFIYDEVDTIIIKSYSKSDVGLGLVFFLVFLILIASGNKILKDRSFGAYILYFLSLVLLLTSSYCYLKKWLVHLNVLDYYQYNNSWYIPLVGLLIISGIVLFYVFFNIISILVGYFKTPKLSRKESITSQIIEVLSDYFIYVIIAGLIAGIHYSAMNSILKNPLPF